MNALYRIQLLRLCALGLFCSSTAYAGSNILYFNSESDDYVGQGTEATFKDPDGRFTLSSYGNGVNLGFNTATYSDWWYLLLTAPQGATLLPGAYENAQRFNSNETPGLAFYGDGRGCSADTGRFDVLEIESDATGTFTKLAVNFEQHCEGMAPALWGQIRYNSDIPLSAKALHISLVNPLNAQQCVEASNPAGASVVVTASDVTDALGGKALSYNWKTTTGESGSDPEFSFTAPLSGAGILSTDVTLIATDLTNNTNRAVNRQLCVSDTTPPTIKINRPFPGEIIHGDNITLDVDIHDAADKNINTYELQVGSDFTSPINPATGHSRQQVLDHPKVNGSIATTVTVRAHDETGNSANKSVLVTQVPKTEHPGRD